MVIDEKFKIQEFEKCRSFFTEAGLDILSFVEYKKSKEPNLKFNFYDYAGEYYLKPEHFCIGNEMVYKKKQYAGEIPAEVVLAYAYNYLGIPAPIAYPYYITSYYKNRPLIADGIITKDILEIFPTAVKRHDEDCHTIKGLYTSDKCDNITRKGKLAKIKDLIAAIAFNNKDAGFDNAFWIKNPKTNMYEFTASIDSGYSGRDSIYAKTKADLLKGLYMVGENGYNGMYNSKEDRGTTLFYLKKLLAGYGLDGVCFTDDEIRELKGFLHKIAKLDFNDIAQSYRERYRYIVSPRFISGLEFSREDLCNELMI